MRLTATLSLLACCALLRAESEAPLPDAAPVPDWALAVLTFKEHGTAQERIGAFCDAVVTNSGALALQSVTSTLFPIPLQEGLDPKGPSALFFLAGKNGAPAQALAVTLSKAKDFEASIRAIFPVEEKDGCLLFSIPGGIDEPERPFAIKVGPNLAIVAPDIQAIRRIEAAAGREGAQAFLAQRPPDVNLCVNVDALWRAYGATLETKLGGAQALVSGLLPSLEPAAGVLRKRLLQYAQEATFLEVRGELLKEGLKITGRAKARKGSPLDERWNREAQKGKDLAKIVPERTGLQIEFHNPRAHDPSRDPVRIGPAPVPAPPSPWFGKLDELISAAELGAAAWTLTAPDGSAQILLVFASKTPAGLEARLEAVLQGIAGFASALAREQMRLQPDDPAPYTLETLPAADGVKGWSVALAKRYRIYPEVKAAFGRAAEWPVTIHATHAEHALVVAAGRNNTAALQALLEHAKRIGDGTESAEASMRLRLRPKDLLHVFLQVVLDPSTHKAAELVKDLPNLAADLVAGADHGSGRFTLEIPTGFAKACFDAYLNLYRAGIDLSRLELPQTDSAPAPPPLP